MASQADARCASRHTALSIWSRRETIVHSVVSLQTTSSVNVSLSCSITGCIESKLHACPTETELLRAESGNNLAWYCLLLLWMRPETFFLCVYACVHLRVCRNSSYVLLLGTERNIFLFFPSSNGWVSLRVRDSVKTWWPPVVGAFLSILYKCTSRSLGFFFFFFTLFFFKVLVRCWLLGAKYWEPVILERELTERKRTDLYMPSSSSLHGTLHNHEMIKNSEVGFILCLRIEGLHTIRKSHICYRHLSIFHRS